MTYCYCVALHCFFLESYLSSAVSSEINNPSISSSLYTTRFLNFVYMHCRRDVPFQIASRS